MATILIVEDDLATSEFFAELLDWNGYETHVAASGSEALAAVEQHAVDAVLLDYRLPDTNGYDLCRQLRAIIGADVPILLVTADMRLIMLIRRVPLAPPACCASPLSRPS